MGKGSDIAYVTQRSAAMHAEPGSAMQKQGCFGQRPWRKAGRKEDSIQWPGDGRTSQSGR